MNWRLFSLAVGLASFSTIALELALTRIFSVTMYYHFAFMVISIAMLGLSVAGVVIYLRPRFFLDRRAPVIAAGFMLAFAVLGVATLAVTLANPISLTHWRQNVGRLGLLYLTTGLTMLMSGFAISVAITAAKERIGQVYATDLVGAALGCIFTIFSISSFGGPGAVIACAATGALSAVLFAVSAGGLASRRVRWGLGLAAGTVALVMLGLAATESEAQRFGAARNSSKFLGTKPVIYEKWNAFSHITVAASKKNDMRWVFIDADAATRIWPKEAVADDYKAMRENGEARLAALVYALRHDRTALIIGPGGGTDVHSALRYGVPKVVGVEVNPIIVEDVVKGEYAEYSGDLYRDPRVEVVVDEGRSFIRRATEPFGTIQATLVDTWAASSSGAFTLSENNIYTVEAFEEFFEHLAPGGIVCVTRWYAPGQPKEFLRLLALAREALERRGVAPASVHDHFLLPTDGGRRGTMLVSRDPFTAEDVAKLAAEAHQGKMGLMYSPLPLPPADASILKTDQVIARFLTAPSALEYLGTLKYDATPTTDDRPFFFYNLWRSDVLGLLSGLGALEINNLGVAILLVLLLVSLLLTVLFVILPLLIFERGALKAEKRRKVRVLGYFLSLGLGFILVEMGFMQHFVLFLGHPIYALAVILASLLASSGAGSACSGWGVTRWGVQGYVRRAIGVLAVLLLIYALVLTPTFRALLGLPLPVRIVMATLLVSLPGFLMGTLLPGGVRVANSLGGGVVSWGWGLNGAASVVGSILAITVSMNFGFTLALIVGIAVYLVGMAFLPPEAPVSVVAPDPVLVEAAPEA